MKNSILFFEKHKYFALFICIFFTFIVRIPFLPSDIRFNNDAEIYNRNIERSFFSGDYDVQMPGYISFIYIGRLISLVIPNPITVQHIINMVIMFFVTISFFFLIKEFHKTNLEAAILTIIFTSNPILLLGSITGGNRIFLCLGSIVLLFYSIKIYIHKNYGKILLYSFFWGIFSGLRQDMSFYFFPLYFFLLAASKEVKIIVSSLLIFFGTCLTWFIPLMAEYGGLSAYLSSMQSAEAVYSTSIIFSGISLSPILNIFRIFIYMINAFILLIILFIIGKKYSLQSYDRRDLMLLSLAFFPALLFQLLVHNGNYVQLASYAVPLFIFLVYHFSLKSLKKLVLSSIIIMLFLFQFYGMKMFDSNFTFPKKLTNVLWLQYTYDGVKSGKTLTLRSIEKEWEKFKKGKR